MNRTHRIFGNTVMAVASLDVSSIFPGAVTAAPVTFKTSIRITADGSVAAEHRGLVFEFGSTTEGTALWVGDQTIGFVSGAATGGINEALALFDNGSVFTDGAEIEIVVAINPGLGRIRMWGNGQEIARDTASDGDLDGSWAAALGDGSFAAAAQGTSHGGVPAASNIAPDGFAVIEPLSVYVGQTPRHMV